MNHPIHLVALVFALFGAVSSVNAALTDERALRMMKKSSNGGKSKGKGKSTEPPNLAGTYSEIAALLPATCSATLISHATLCTMQMGTIVQMSDFPQLGTTG